MSTPVLYFAYGSNMSQAVMDRIVPGNRVLGAARLPDYRLAFTRDSIRWNGGAADIVRAEGMMVRGVVYEIDEADLTQLDIKENVAKGGYRREAYTLLMGTPAEEVRVISYTVVSKSIDQPPWAELPPTEPYITLMIEGAEEHNLPEDYKTFLYGIRDFAHEQFREGFVCYPNDDQPVQSRANAVVMSSVDAKRLGIQDCVIVEFGGKCCEVDVQTNEDIAVNTCQLSQAVRNELGFGGSDLYGVHVKIVGRVVSD